MIKVCVIGLRGFPNVQGGVEKHCENLYPRISENFNFFVYRRKPYINNTRTYPNISYIDLPSTKIKGFETLFHSLISTINATIRKPDVVHYHNIGPALFSFVPKLRRIKVVLTYHSANYEHKKWGFFARVLLHLAEKVAFFSADKIIFVNEFQMKKVHKNILNKSIYIPNGINRLPDSASDDILLRFCLKKDQYILSVGRITPEKGFDILIRAFNLLKNDELKLVIAGGVEHEHKYMKYLNSLVHNDSIVFTGSVTGNELSQLYKNAKLLVISSRNEGFPLVLLEALQFNLSIIASNIPAMHIVELGDKNYFENENVYDLAKKIADMLITRVNVHYDLAEYDWDKIAYLTANVYKGVLGVD